MKDRLFSIMGFGKRSEALAAQLKSDGINYGWGVETRLLLLIIDSNEIDSFIIRLCNKAKEKGTSIVFISLYPELSTKALGYVANGFLFNDNEKEVASIVRTLHDVIYRHNILSYGINDVIKFLHTDGTARIAIQKHEFDGLNISQAGNVNLPKEKNAQVRYLTFIRLCQPFSMELLNGVKKVFADAKDFTINSIIEIEDQSKSELAVISISEKQ